MKFVIAFACFAILFCLYRITEDLLVLIPTTYRTWHIVKYLKKSAMISYVVSEAERKGLFERYKEILLKHGKMKYIARKDSEGIIWLGDFELNKIVYDPPKIEKIIGQMRENINNKGEVLFCGFFLKELVFIQKTILAIN